MKLLHFILNDQKYYLDDVEIGEDTAKSILNEKQFKLLLKNKSINIRGNSNIDAKSLKIDSKQEEIKSTTKLSKADLKLISKYKSDYKVEHTTYAKSGPKIEMWRKNKRYGYYNFAAYLDSDEQEVVDLAILNDIREQSRLASEKKKKSSIIDDDI